MPTWKDYAGKMDNLGYIADVRLVIGDYFCISTGKSTLIERSTWPTGNIT